MCNELSRLEPVELREVWPNEATDFTPWLAEEENLSILADTLNMELELEGSEVNVESGIVDLLCRNTDDSLVLIENKLTKTNHAHLGQILTYAAARPEATAFVWIAKSFQEKHRAALDRLNEITAERFQFFGVEIELWRIGNSSPAPKFNIVSSPNDWIRSVFRGLTETQLQQMQYWTGLAEYMSDANCQISSPNPVPEAYVFLPLGKASIRLKVSISKGKRRLSVGLDMFDEKATAYFNLLVQNREEIEQEFGISLEWDELPAQKSSRVSLHKKDTDPTDEEDWPDQHAWLAEKLKLFDRVFRDRIRDLDAGDGQPEDEDDE